MINHLTIIETAKILGVSTQTVRRLIQRKMLVAKQSLGPHGIRWEIERAEILRYLETLKNLDQPLQQAQQIGVGVVELTKGVVVEKDGPVGVNNPSVDHGQQPQQPLRIDVGVVELAKSVVVEKDGPVEVNNRSVDHGQQTQQPLRIDVGVVELAKSVVVEKDGPVEVNNRSVDHGQQPQQVVPLAAHLAALELLGNLQSELTVARRQAEQAERAKMALEWQMHKYQAAIADQAESLAEAQAMRRVAEARLETSFAEPVEAPLENLKVGGPQRKGWGQRLRSWLGFSETG